MKYILLIYLLSGYAPGPVFQTFDDQQACRSAERAVVSAIGVKGNKTAFIICLPAGTIKP